MNPHDPTDVGPTDPGDALARRAASALRSDVERRVDVDAALARVLDAGATPRVIATTSAAGGSSPRPGHPVWIGAAAAVLLLGAGSLAFALSRDDRTRVVPADTTPVTDGTTITTITTEPSTPGTTVPSLTPSTVTDTSPAPTMTTVFFPQARVVDALAGLVAPDPLDPADVPALLPTAPVADPAQVQLDEYVMPIDSVTRLVQTWATEDGRVLQVTTQLAGGEPPVSVPTQESNVEVWPWDDGVVVESMADGFAQVHLSDPSGSVTLRGAGFTSDDLVAVGFAMALTPDGWIVTSAADRELVELHSGWTRALFATRTMQWDTGTALGELIVTLGSPESVTTGYFGTTDGAGLDDVQGAPALVTDLGTNSIVTWSPAPDVVVALGYSGTPDRALALARSLEPVDVATWRAAGVLDTLPADGCDSYFFC